MCNTSTDKLVLFKAKECEVTVWCGANRQKGDANRVRDFLPADKQYLITRNGQSKIMKT